MCVLKVNGEADLQMETVAACLIGNDGDDGVVTKKTRACVDGQGPRESVDGDGEPNPRLKAMKALTTTGNAGDQRAPPSNRLDGYFAG